MGFKLKFIAVYKRIHAEFYRFRNAREMSCGLKQKMINNVACKLFLLQFASKCGCVLKKLMVNNSLSIAVRNAFPLRYFVLVKLAKKLMNIFFFLKFELFCGM